MEHVDAGIAQQSVDLLAPILRVDVCDPCIRLADGMDGVMMSLGTTAHALGSLVASYQCISRSATTICRYQAPGDVLLYKGAELPHFRGALPDGRASTSILFHYVPADFDGSLS
ncbi:hypothetical protein ACMHYB_37430 [Sorangium sp. So ce1128]